MSSELAPIEAALKHVSEHPQAITLRGLDPDLLRTMDTMQAGRIATYAGVLDDVSMWLIADLLAWADTFAARHAGATSGKQYWARRNAMWGEILKLTKKDYDRYTVLHLRRTAQRWPHHRRYESAAISFEHHRLLNSLTDEQQDEYMDMVESTGLTTSQLRRILQKNGDGTADLPDPVVVDTNQRKVYELGSDAQLRWTSPSRLVVRSSVGQIDIRATVDDEGNPEINIHHHQKGAP